MIPDAAVEAAARYMADRDGEIIDWTEYAIEVRPILEAAAPHMLAEAWEAGAKTAWSRSTPEVNGAAYKWRNEGDPVNPYR